MVINNGGGGNISGTNVEALKREKAFRREILIGRVQERVTQPEKVRNSIHLDVLDCVFRNGNPSYVYTKNV